jgi:hypothetical protein
MNVARRLEMSDQHSSKQNRTRRHPPDGRANNRTPEHTRFKPGSSGNLKGRPKRRLSQFALLRRILNESAIIREGERVRKMTKYEAMQYTLVHKAMKGDPKAFKLLMEIVKEDPSSLDAPPLLQFIFSDETGPVENMTPEERQEWQAWRAARKKKSE